MNEKEILFSLDAVDEEYLEEAKPMKKQDGLIKTIAVVASLTLVVGLSLWIMLGNGTDTPDNIYDIPDNLYSEYTAGENYSRLTAIINAFGKNDLALDLQFNIESGFFGDTGAPGGNEGNGGYISVTENQVENVEEPDIFKMTDKYIFRIGGVKDGGEALRIYTLDGDNSKQVGEFNIPYFDGSKYGIGAKMFLSKDGKTVTIIKNDFGFEDENGICTTTLMIIDTSDVSSPELVKHITVNGLCDFVRNTDGKIVLGTDFVSTLSGYDWSDPEEYLPYYKVDDVKTYFSPEDIICPEKIYQREYSSFFILDEELNVLSTKAVFGITGLSYVSEDKIVTSVGYGRKYENADDGNIDCKTDITVIDYSSGVLKIQSVLTADGWVRDRFFIDENDGHLRVITNDFTYQSRLTLASQSTSLYIFRLNDCSLVASVKDFAPEGESATSVRFDGDKCYVCTAEIRTFADPVYFFDLSNYRHISQVNTGFIDGFSSVLINYNDNFLVGIGAKDAETNKVSVYKREGDSVVTVAEYYFKGVFSTDRKAFIIDKENGIFGFASNSYYDDEGNRINGAYHLLQFNGENIKEIFTVEENHNVSSLRSVYHKGYLYIVRNMDIRVFKVD